MIARRAASSAAAAARTICRRLALLAGLALPERQGLLPWEEIDGVDDDLDDGAVGAPGLGDVAGEIEWLQRLAALADAARQTSSKLTVVRRLLNRTRESLIVFSEYRDVVLQVESALRDITTVAALHGGLSARERNRVVTAFNDGRVRTLVATDAAGEGLNLHARCRLVVNIELPWTPQRLEQRIGRVDRMGQMRRVHAIHLAHRGSYEGTVITRLERRRARAAGSFDTAGPRETHHAEAARRLTSPRTSLVNAGASCYAATPPRRAGRLSVLLMFSVAIADSNGGLVGRRIITVRVRAAASRRLTRRNVRWLAAHPSVLDCVTRTAARLLADARRATVPASAAFGTRVTAALFTLQRRRAARHRQALLFDRRAEQDAARNAADTAVLSAYLERRGGAYRARLDLQHGNVRLVAAWLGDA